MIIKTAQDNLGGTYEVTLQSNILFAYNYNSIKIKCTYQSAAQRSNFLCVAINGKSITAYNRNDEYEICLDSLLMAFASTFNYTLDTLKNTKLEIIDEPGDPLTFSDGKEYLDISVVYGSLMYGQRTADIGVVNSLNNPFVRNMTWFSQYETLFSVLAQDGQSVYEYDQDPQGDFELEDTYGYSVNQVDRFTMDAYNSDTKMKLFIITDDYKDISDCHTKRQVIDKYAGKKSTTIIFGDLSSRKDGYFLRWIDNRGLWYSYLFDKGQSTKEISHSEYRTNSIITKNGVQYLQTSPISSSVTEKVTCSAVLLDNDRYADISTIANALYVEMYIDGSYKRVNVVSTSLKKDEQKNLNDVEVEIEVNKTTLSI